jgi:hypothetical protein
VFFAMLQQQQQQHDMEVFLQQLLLDPNSPISDRWRALFTLRNLKGDGPRQALIKGRSVGRPVCLSGLVFLFCVVDRPGVLFLGFLAPWFVFMAG